MVSWVHSLLKGTRSSPSPTRKEFDSFKNFYNKQVDHKFKQPEGAYKEDAWRSDDNKNIHHTTSGSNILSRRITRWQSSQWEAPLKDQQTELCPCLAKLRIDIFEFPYLKWIGVIKSFLMLLPLHSNWRIKIKSDDLSTVHTSFWEFSQMLRWVCQCSVIIICWSHGQVYCLDWTRVPANKGCNAFIHAEDEEGYKSLITMWRR